MFVSYTEPDAIFIGKKRRITAFAVLTREDSGHKRGKHEKKKREEQTASVVEDFTAVVSNAVI